MNNFSLSRFLHTYYVIIIISKTRRCIMNHFEFKENTWRLLIIDKSGLYSQIHDEIYGNNPDTLADLVEMYSDRKKYQCLVL